MSVRCEDRLDLAAVASAAGCARMFTRLTLTRWGAADLLEDALLIVSGLVTNAVKATGITEPDPDRGVPAPLGILTVHLFGLDTSIVIAVWEAGPCQPVVRHADLDEEGGRGLNIVEHLAWRWGTCPHRGGKVVWAELPVRSPPPDKLPKRQPARASHAAHLPAARQAPDPQLLRRVIHGLREL